MYVMGMHLIGMHLIGVYIMGGGECEFKAIGKIDLDFRKLGFDTFTP